MNIKYNYHFIYEYKSIDGKFMLTYLDEYPQSFIPYELFGEAPPFSNSSRIVLENEKRGAMIISENKEFFMVGSVSQNRLQPRKFRSHIVFENKCRILANDEIEYFIHYPSFKIGFEQNQEYYKKQSDDNPQSYKYINPHKYGTNKKEIKEFEKETGLSLYFNENVQLYRIDISNNPGRERYLPGMEFIPAYKIWYGKEAQELFGKQKILDYPNAIYTKELENGVIEMQLMDDITKCNLPYNQEKQRDIVKYFEIEKLEVDKY